MYVKVSERERERERERGWRVAPAGLLFDKEATTLFYNCVFNLMDSLMRFVVYSSVRGRANDGDRTREARAKRDEK